MRTIVPTELYTRLAGEIEKHHKIADALSAVFWALRNNAEDYPIMKGYQFLRMAKTL